MANIKKGKISDLVPDLKNINKGSEFGNHLLEKSLRESGAGRSIVVDKNMNVLAGNKTLEKAGELGFENTLIVQTTGRDLVVVQRTDLDINSEAGVKYKILDNTVSKHNYVEDIEVSEALVSEYKINAVAYGLEENEKPEIKEDEFQIPDAIKTDIVLGDLFEIGEHRLLCGDSTKAKWVQKLLREWKAILMVTDPPYGVNYDPGWRKEHNETKGFKAKTVQTGKVQNDDKADWTETYQLFTGDIAYIWHGGKHSLEVAQNLISCGFQISYQIIWNKLHGVFGRGDYHWQHEPCWYAVKKGAKHNWQGDRTQTTVWDIKGFNPNGNNLQKTEEKTGHGTQKPVECMARPIKNNTSAGEGVYDPFLGSGTTMIAAHQLNRKCFGMEISPEYCQVTIDRMIKLDPSITIKKNGKPFYNN